MASPPRTPDDGELLAEARGGDAEAFVEVYRRHKDRVFRFAYRMTGSSEMARDVTHTCFASLLERTAAYDPRRASLGTYLCAAARNQCLRIVSRRAREVPADEDARPGREPDALESLLLQERGEVVRKALAGLSPDQREVVILADYEELDMATIAAIVGADVGAVRVRLHRARRRLRDLLAPFLEAGIRERVR